MNDPNSFAMQSPGNSNNNAYYDSFLASAPSVRMPPYQQNGGQNSVAAATGATSVPARVPRAGEPSNGVITQVNSNDVLLGRGKETINYIGNIRFRAIIEEKKVRRRYA